MAITDINISEQLETGAPSIKYTGNEGPQASPQHQQEMQIAQQIWEAMGDEERGQFSNFQEFFRSGIWKQILQQAQQDEAQGIQSLGPRNMEPNRMGAEYGGRIGYDNGGDVMMAYWDPELADWHSNTLFGKDYDQLNEDQMMEIEIIMKMEYGKKETAPQGTQMAAKGDEDWKDLVDVNHPSYNADYESLSKGGRIGFDNGGFTIDDAMAEEDRKVRESYKAYERYKASGGTKSYEEFMRMVGVGGLAQGGRIGARLGGDMEELSMRETIDTPEGIETLKETDTMKMAGGGARGWKAQMLAEDLAQEEYGKDFYDLSQDKQMEIYQIALDMIDSGGQ